MKTQINEVVDFLRRAALRQGDGGLTDGQLLARFIEHREQAAVAALVQRHGPMVWGVCRRILRSHHDAEDAFQATFLVLVRKAVSIRHREKMANWLYGVAHQTAIKARAILAKRRTREKPGTAMPEPQAPEQDTRNDLRALLDQELSRLPDKYRVAIVLCDLEEKTRREAARQLDLPEGTLAGRLTRGRAMLARRLARRGPAVSGGALVAVFSQEAASAGVPISVLASTIKAASMFAAGQAAATGAISVHVAALTERMLNAMLLAKLRIALTLVLAVALALAGVAHHFVQTQAAGAQPSPKRDQPVPGGQPATSPKPDAVLLALAQGGNQAENLFRESEKKLSEADQAQITVESTLERGTLKKGHLKGTLLLAKGNKANMAVQGNLDGEEFKMSAVSNGSKMKMEVTMSKPQEEQNTPKDLNAMFAGSFSRVGVLAGFRTRTQQAGEQEPGLDDLYKVSDFVLGKKEKVGERESQVIEYKLVMDNRDTAETTIWLDTETKLPLKRVFNSKNDNESYRVTETYQIRINGQIDEKKFELPK
jgi:RNA polymerase sigma factor (sigma-70 family)